MKQIIKDFMMKYTDPKVRYSGISADELAKLLESELRVVRLKESLEDAKEVLNKKPKLNCKLGGIDDSLGEAMGFEDVIDKLDKDIAIAGFKTRPLKKVVQVDIYDRELDMDAVDDAYANLVKK